MRTDAESVLAIERLAHRLTHVIDVSDVAQVSVEWGMYAMEQIPESWCTAVTQNRLEDYWGQVSKLTLSSGEPKFKYLPKLVKSYLALFHGNAELERGFSENAKILTSDRARLSPESVFGLRSVKDSKEHR